MVRAKEEFAAISTGNTGTNRVVELVCGSLGPALGNGFDRSVLEEGVRNGVAVVDWVLDNVQPGDSEFGEALALRLGLPWEEDPVVDEGDFEKLKRTCPPTVGIKYRALPVRGQFTESGDVRSLTLATYDPLASFDRVMVRRALDCPIEWVVAPRRRVRAGLQKLYGVGGHILDDLIANREWDSDDFDFKEKVNVIDESDEEATVVNFVNSILNEALNQRATDIHIEPLAHDLRVRYRIDGLLRVISVPENIKKLQTSVIARLKLMAGLDIAEKRKPQDGRIALRVGGEPIDTRVATIPGIEGESISLRLLGQEQFNIEKLEMFPYLRKDVDDILAKPNGIVLVTGPTGCGKSTSLFCFLSVLNSDDTKVVTIEDPVENRLAGALQIAVRPEIGLTFASGLRSILRGDPNVVMVGEIRDVETAEIAVQAALTGHLVFSTLHTNDSVGGITRLADMGVEPFLIAAAVRAFIAQRLVRKLCVSCRQPADYSPDYLRLVGFAPHGMENVYKANEDGCESCGHTGYRGRTAVYELFRVSEPVQELVVAGASKQDLMRQAMLDGFVNMREYGWQKVREGVTTIEEVVSSTEVG